MVSGKSFQSLSAISEKTLSPEEIVLVFGTDSRFKLLKRWEPGEKYSSIMKHHPQV